MIEFISDNKMISLLVLLGTAIFVFNYPFTTALILTTITVPAFHNPYTYIFLLIWLIVVFSKGGDSSASKDYRDTGIYSGSANSSIGCNDSGGDGCG